MKKIFQIIIAVILPIGFFTSCELDEWNPSTVDIEKAYKDKDGYESLINYCYDALYYFYGKVDGIGAMEMGTDSWANTGTNDVGFILYNANLNTSNGTLKTIWQGLYATSNYCNLAIYNAKTVAGYPTREELNAKVAEAHFLRAWANWHLVEQFGGVVLNELPSTVSGIDNYPKRSSEEDFYNLIFSDLEFACQHLPLTQSGERGRVSKKAAYALLAKAALQRTRLGNKEEYAKKALDAAEELINNQSKYGIALYRSDANQSGFAKLWAGANNKNNTESLFLEAIDHVGGKNPDAFNRGRTRQYYVMDCRTVGSVWGTQESDIWLSRANSRNYKPTKYLLTTLFPPVKNPADTRFAETFFYEYYVASGTDKEITQAMVTEYNKNPALAGRKMLATNGTFRSLARGGKDVTVMGQKNMVDNNGDGYLDGLCIYTPNWTMTAVEKRDLPFWVVDPADMFDASGKWISVETNPALGGKIKEIYPSLKKFSCLEYVDDRQQWLGDIPIIRLGEVYLIAAEAALLYNGDKAKAQGYVNDIRKRAAVTGRENEMTVSQNDVTLDFILAERGRELCGEQVRWYDLKRMGKITAAYLLSTNPDILTVNENLHQVRPIPQSYLDAISNPEEFGANGY